MAAATGYQGYGSPERAKVDRERRLAELLQQGALDTGPKSLWEGVAQLGKAFIARDAMNRADKAEGAYGDSQRRAFDLLSSQMFPDSASSSVATGPQGPGTGADRAARLMARANPEAIDPTAAMVAPATAPASSTITRTDLPPLPPTSPGTKAIAEALSRQGGPVSPYMQEYAQPAPAAAPAAPPMAQPAPQTQPQPSMNPTARIAGALMAQPPMQKPPMQPQGQQPQNIRAAVEQYFQMTGDMAGALELGKSMQPAAPELQALQGPDGAISVFDQRSGAVKQIKPGTLKPADPVKMETIQAADGRYYTFNPVTGETKPLDVRGRVPGSDGSGGIKPPSGYRYTQDPETGATTLEPIPGGPADRGLNMNPQFIQMELQQSKDWKGVYNNFSDINDQANRIRTMAARKDPAGDLALVVSFTKMLDPGSVAREGEVALTQSAASALQQAQTWLPRLEQGGTLLPDALRQDLLKAGEEMYNVYEQKYHDIAGDYVARSQAYGFAPERVLMGYRPPKPNVAPRPERPGTILGGTGEFNPAAFQGLMQPGAGLTPDEARRLQELEAEFGGQ